MRMPLMLTLRAPLPGQLTRRATCHLAKALAEAQVCILSQQNRLILTAEQCTGTRS